MPGENLVRVLHGFISDGMRYRLRTFCNSLASLTDEELFEVMRCYNSPDRSEEATHKGLHANGELKRRYALDPDLWVEKYFEWLEATGRSDSHPPDVRAAFLNYRRGLREQGKSRLH
jgi:hypothetical protein